MKQLLLNTLVLGFIALAFPLAPLQAQDDVGPEIGTEIRDFRLKDQKDESQRFSELLSSGPAVVFHRSADW